MEAIKIESEVPPPKKRSWNRRLVEFKDLEVGQSVLVDFKTALALQSKIRYGGGNSVRRTEGSEVRVWRTA
jgi:hypothetical protein